MRILNLTGAISIFLVLSSISSVVFVKSWFKIFQVEIISDPFPITFLIGLVSLGIGFLGAKKFYAFILNKNRNFQLTTNISSIFIMILIFLV